MQVSDRAAIIAGLALLSIPTGFGRFAEPQGPTALASSSESVSNIEPEDRPDYAAAFPAKRLPPYDLIFNADLVRALKSSLVKEFARDGVTGPEEYFKVIDNPLVAVEMSEQDRRNTWNAILDSSLLNTADKRNLIRTLAAHDPDGNYLEVRSANLEKIPGMEGGRINVDIQAYHQFAPIRPLQLSVISGDFIPGDPLNEGKEWREIITTVSALTSDDVAQEIYNTGPVYFKSDDKALYNERLFELPLDVVKQLLGENSYGLKLHIAYSARPAGLNGDPAPVDAPSLRGEAWILLTPFGTADGTKTFKTSPLGPYGAVLVEPGMVEVAGITAFTLSPKQKTALRTRIDREFKAGHQQSQIIGKPFGAFDVITAADGTTTKLPVTGDALIVAGATWCAPCKAIAPKLKESSESWGSKVNVVHLSVDRELDKYGAALSQYPNGIITVNDQDKLGITAVPFFIQIKNGVVVDAGILTPKQLERFKW